MVKIFIDDERFPPDDGSDWKIVRNMKEFKALFAELSDPPEFVSFDHDLGDNEPTGFDIAKRLVEFDQEYWNSTWNMNFYVHSQNPIGKANIEGYLNGWARFKTSN